jgi:ubiquinone/menaquinone biosynthesis C-methylase UbiE
MLRAQNEDLMITNAMGGPLTEQSDASIFQHILHIACGSGGWTIEAALRYPTMSLLGIDNNPRIIDYARENAIRAGVAERVKFRVMDALGPFDLPDDHFDLINLRLGVTFLRTWDWPKLLSEMMRMMHPGGVIRLTEPQVLHEQRGSSSNPALAKIHNALLGSLYHSGHLFEENTTGLTLHLAPLLLRYGCNDVQTKAYSLEFRAGTPEWQEYYNNGKRVIKSSKPFLTRWGRISGDYDALAHQAIEEMLKPDYHSVWHFLTVWGKTPL